MQAIYEYTGIVEAVCDLQTFPSGFTKQDLVLTDDNDVQTKYPNHIAFTFKKDNTAKLNNVQKGQRAKVRFAIYNNYGKENSSTRTAPPPSRCRNRRTCRPTCSPATRTTSRSNAGFQISSRRLDRDALPLRR